MTLPNLNQVTNAILENETETDDIIGKLHIASSRIDQTIDRHRQDGKQPPNLFHLYTAGTYVLNAIRELTEYEQQNDGR